MSNYSQGGDDVRFSSHLPKEARSEATDTPLLVCYIGWSLHEAQNGGLAPLP
jgi:hypothetical protein